MLYNTIKDYDTTIIDKHLIQNGKLKVLNFFPNYDDINIHHVTYHSFSNILSDNNIVKSNQYHLPFDIESAPGMGEYDLILFNRIIEHIPFNNISFLLYQLKRKLKPNGVLHILYPDMTLITKTLNKISFKNLKNYSLFQFYNIELFNEGDSYDIHKTFTNRKFIKYATTAENIFSIISEDLKIAIETPRYVYNSITLLNKSK